MTNSPSADEIDNRQRWAGMLQAPTRAEEEPGPDRAADGDHLHLAWF